MSEITSLFTVANEAYQGEDSIKPIVDIIKKAQNLYPKNEHAAYKELDKLTVYLTKLFNFKNCTLQVNKTTFWFGSTTSVGRFTIGNGDTKLITNEDFEQSVKTYRFVKPIINCNLSLYAPNILDSSRISPREVTALIVREIGYSFFAWGTGRKAEEGIRTAISQAITFGDSDTPASIKIAGLITDLTLKYAPNFKFGTTGGTQSGVVKLFHDIMSGIGHAAQMVLIPIAGVINLIMLPFSAIGATVDKFFGISFDEVDNFADAFAASYGLAGDLASAMEKESKMRAIGSERYGENFRLYADIMGASIGAYTMASGKNGVTNTGAILPRIEKLVMYYEDLLKEQKNPKIKKEINDKLKSLRAQYNYLKSLPRETNTISSFIAKLWTRLFGSDTEAIDRFDREIKNGKSSK